MLREEQDKHLDEINDIAKRLKTNAININVEIEKQGEYLVFPDMASNLFIGSFKILTRRWIRPRQKWVLS